MKIEPEDFQAWLANPITERVHAALEAFAAEAKATWIEHSWGGGAEHLVLDQLRLRDLKARHDVAIDLKNWTLEDIEEILDDDSGKAEA